MQLFAKGLELLDDYDHEQLDAEGRTINETVYPALKEYLQIIAGMQSEFNCDVFAKPKDKSFESSIRQIELSLKRL